MVFPWCYWEVHPSCQRQRGSSSDTLKLQEKINGPKFKARAAHCSSSCLQLLDIPNAPQRTFPALPAARLPSPSASATERPPPAFGSASTGLAPGKRQQLGHLRDTSEEERWCSGGGLLPGCITGSNQRRGWHPGQKPRQMTSALRHSQPLLCWGPGFVCKQPCSPSVRLWGGTSVRTGSSRGGRPC